MTNKAFCEWCWEPLSVPESFDQSTHATTCTDGACTAAEVMFRDLYSDKRMLDEEYLEELTQGDDYD